jgi:hypothetical protein
MAVDDLQLNAGAGYYSVASPQVFIPRVVSNFPLATVAGRGSVLAPGHSDNKPHYRSDSRATISRQRSPGKYFHAIGFR